MLEIIWMVQTINSNIWNHLSVSKQISSNLFRNKIILFRIIHINTLTHIYTCVYMTIHTLPSWELNTLAKDLMAPTHVLQSSSNE